MEEKDLDKKFKNLYWSWIISMQDYRPGEYQRWPLLPDIKEDIEILFMVGISDD